MFNYYLDYMQLQWLLDLFKVLIVNVIITSNKLQAVMESNKVCNVVVAAVPDKWYIMVWFVSGPKWSVNIRKVCWGYVELQS